MLRGTLATRLPVAVALVHRPGIEALLLVPGGVVPGHGQFDGSPAVWWPRLAALSP